MPTYAVVQIFPFPLSSVFDFFKRPANVVAVAPPELHLRLVEGPEVVAVGASIMVQTRRWGVRQRMVTEVVALEEDRLIVEEQIQGPFRSWRHERRFAESEQGTEVSETIVYDPPDGLLGLMMTPAVIESELSQAFSLRQELVNERMSQSTIDLLRGAEESSP